LLRIGLRFVAELECHRFSVCPALRPARAAAHSSASACKKLVPKVPEELRLAWEATARAALAAPQPESRWERPAVREQFAIIVTCRDEAHQIELLRRFHEEWLECMALLS
jgi:hypothetical protein